MEQVEAQEVFQECDTVFKKEECKEYFSDLNLEYKFATEKGHQEKVAGIAYCKQTNNNHHVVQVGIIIVFFTISLGMMIGVQKCLVSCSENTLITEQVQQYKDTILNHQREAEKIENTKILERLLEYKDICKDLAIFTKDIENKRQEVEEGDESDNDKENTNEILKDKEDSSMEYEDNSGSSGNDDCEIRNKHKKSKYSMKAASTKNGFNKYNKSSTKAKYQKNPKKDLNLNKKNSTAEPIIYLFALVFIYLLLKAASDINQHYKSLKLRLKSLSRASSQDQQNYHYNHHQQQHLMDGSPQKSTEQKQQATTVSPIRPNASYNWQLLRQHTTTQSLDNSDILKNTRGNAETSSSMLARRCSVPAALSYQRKKCVTASPLGIVTDHVNWNVSLSRRTSITSSPLPFAVDPNDSLAPEAKRRVRMINRH